MTTQLLKHTESAGILSQMKKHEKMLQATAQVNHILLENECIDTAIYKAFKVIGEATGVDRLYVFENYNDPESGKLFCNQRIEWALDSVSPQIDNEELQGFPFEDLTPRWLYQFKQGEVISGLVKDFPEAERAILEPQDIVSIIAVPVRIKGELWGFVGFDNCREEYEWSRQEADVLTSLASNIGLAFIRARTQQELEENNKMYEQISENIDEVIFLKDKHMKPVHINSAFERMFGIQAKELELPAGEIKSQIKPQELEKLRMALKNTVSEFEFTFETANGKIKHISNKRFPVVDDQGNTIRYVGMMNDISKIRRAKNSLKKALRHEKDLNDLKNRFISMISHEIRTPVTAIMSSASLLNDYSDKITNEKRTQLNQRILSASNKIVSLLEQVLLMGKSEAGKLVPEYSNVNLGGLVDELLAELKDGILKDHEIKMSCVVPAGGYDLDSNLIRHILVNLLENAAKYSEKDSEILIGFKVFGDELNFMVKDHGIGIDADEHDKIFEPFYRSDEVVDTNGTGLGMAIAKTLTEAMDGAISVESEKGKGASFFVSIPVTANSAETVPCRR